MFQYFQLKFNKSVQSSIESQNEIINRLVKRCAEDGAEVEKLEREMRGARPVIKSELNNIYVRFDTLEEDISALKAAEIGKMSADELDIHLREMKRDIRALKVLTNVERPYNCDPHFAVSVDSYPTKDHLKYQEQQNGNTTSALGCGKAADHVENRDNDAPRS